MKSGQNKRAVRTKKRLTECLMTLMHTRSLQDVTVSELTKLAGVNRGTFYLYYHDLPDMLAKIESEMFAAFEQIIRAHREETVLHQTLPFLQELFAFAAENRSMVSVLLGRNGDMSFLRRLDEVVYDKCLTDCRSLFPDEASDTFPFRYNFAVFGCIGTVRAWVDGGCVQNSDDMARLVDSMIRSGVVRTSSGA